MKEQFNGENILFHAIHFNQAVLLQFSISVDFVYSVKCQNSSTLNKSVLGKYSFNIRKQFHFK